MSKLTDEERRRQSDAAAAVTGTRWCQHGSHYAPADSVTFVSTRNGRRHICAACLSRRKQTTTTGETK